jgi:hypothetical protein
MILFIFKQKHITFFLVALALHGVTSSDGLSSHILFKKIGRVSTTTGLNAQKLDHPDFQHTIGVSSPTSLREEAEILKAKAERLRVEIENQQGSKEKLETQRSSDDTTDQDDTTTSSVSAATVSSPWSIIDDGDDEDGEEYRLYIDIGREEGTWMDPRWGASGNRVPFTLDAKLLFNRLANEDVAKNMVKDNTMGRSSPVYTLKTGEFARLRDGFDRMRSFGGAYRIDVANNGQYTVRMMIEVDGTKADQNYVYGDVSIPTGYLYFSIPCFGGRIDQLSTKEGPVTVRETGWHTGWRRKESRIVGVFKAKSIAQAQKKDSY